MPAVRRNLFVTFGWRIHRAIFRATAGRVGSRIGAFPVLLLTTRGRKSGARRDVTLSYVRDHKVFVVVASYAGEPRDPAWWQNLKAHPEAEVLVDGRRLTVNAREAEGAKRELLWTRIVASDPAYADYQRRTERRLAVVLLEPV